MTPGMDLPVKYVFRPKVQHGPFVDALLFLQNGVGVLDNFLVKKNYMRDNGQVADSIINLWYFPKPRTANSMFTGLAVHVYYEDLREPRNWVDVGVLQEPSSAFSTAVWIETRIKELVWPDGLITTNRVVDARLIRGKGWNHQGRMHPLDAP